MKYFLVVITLLFFWSIYSCKNSEKSIDIYSQKTEDSYLIYHHDKAVLGYQYSVMQPPEGVDSLFRRSGFIHPLKTPRGKVLTRIQPDDHYHHYGIWNPWTHALYKGDTLDFWNLGKGQGTVRFAQFLDESANGYTALHEHVVLKDDKEEVALLETQEVRISPSKNDSVYVVDLTFTYECATDEPFKILEYRYAGFSWRATEEWNNQNSSILASEGQTREHADGSLARWVMAQGKLGEGNGGAIMLSHPENFNHPEPLRVWPVDMYDRGDVFLCFCTTKNTDWEFEPGKTYTLKYQFVVFDGNMTKEKANSFWSEFASE